jgi:hypothetical protein
MTKRLSLTIFIIALAIQYSCEKSEDLTTTQTTNNWKYHLTDDGDEYIELSKPVDLIYNNHMTNKSVNATGVLRAYSNNTYTITTTSTDIIPLKENYGIGFKISCFNTENDHLISDYQNHIDNYKESVQRDAYYDKLDSEQRSAMKEQLDNKLDMFELPETHIFYMNYLFKDETYNVYGNKLLLEMKEYDKVTCFGWRYNHHMEYIDNGELGIYKRYTIIDEDWDIKIIVNSIGFKEAWNQMLGE